MPLTYYHYFFCPHFSLYIGMHICTKGISENRNINLFEETHVCITPSRSKQLLL